MSSLYDKLGKLTDGDDPQDDEPKREKITTSKLDLGQLEGRFSDDSSGEKEPSTQTEMGETYTNLSAKLEDDESDEDRGFTTLDIAALPVLQRKIMFGILRNKKASAEGVGTTQEEIEAIVKDEKSEDIAEALQKLQKDSWLIVFGEAPNQRYKINLRRKRGNDGSLWSSLASRLFES